MHWHADVRADNRFISTATRDEVVIFPSETSNAVAVQLDRVNELRSLLVVDLQHSIAVAHAEHVTRCAPLDRLNFIHLCGDWMIARVGHLTYLLHTVIETVPYVDLAA